MFSFAQICSIHVHIIVQLSLQFLFPFSLLTQNPYIQTLNVMNLLLLHERDSFRFFSFCPAHSLQWWSIPTSYFPFFHLLRDDFFLSCTFNFYVVTFRSLPFKAFADYITNSAKKIEREKNLLTSSLQLEVREINSKVASFDKLLKHALLAWR